jgi:outer membrane lipoprotein-sorting protein
MRATLLLLLTSAAIACADETALNSWLERQAQMRTLDVRFTQERKLPALKEPVRTPGRLSFRKPSDIRWQLGEPAATVITGDGKKITIVDHAEKEVREIAADSPQAARFAMLGGREFADAATFRETFEFKEHRVVSGIHQYTLRPRDRRTRARVPWVFLDIDPVKNELRALEIEMQDGSRVRSVFQHPSINAPLPDSHFKIEAADGYTRL